MFYRDNNGIMGTTEGYREGYNNGRMDCWKDKRTEYEIRTLVEAQGPLGNLNDFIHIRTQS